MKRVLVLGSTGFIGQSLVNSLRKTGKCHVVSHTRKNITTNNKDIINFPYESLEFKLDP